ncbi:MAG: histidine kinase [Cytophagales bacterium]|nr:histidine kinase [Cytophagales bacterium]
MLGIITDTRAISERNPQFYDSLYNYFLENEDAELDSLINYARYNEDFPDQLLPKFWKLVLKRTENNTEKQIDFAHALFYMSISQTIAGDMAPALEMAKKALVIFDSAEMYLEVADCYNTIGGMLANDGDVDGGIKSLKKAIRVSQKNPIGHHYENAIINHYLVLGYVFGEGNYYDSAILYTLKAAELAESTSTPERKYLKEKASARNNIGYFSMVKGDIISSKAYLKEGLTFCPGESNKRIEAAIHSKLGMVYIREGKTDSAMIHLDLGLDICRNFHTFLPRWLQLLNQKQQLLQKQGNFEEALQAANRYIFLKDSSSSLEKERLTQFFLEEFKASEKDREIQNLSQQAEIQRLQLQEQKTFLVGGGILGLLLIGGGLMFYNQNKLKGKQKVTEVELQETKKRLHLEKQYRASELKALRSQMNPHFVFNALNSIQEYIMSNEKNLAGKYLGKFADLMRVYLHHSQVKVVTLKEELFALNLYVELESLRFENKLTYDIKVDEPIDTNHEIPSLMIQPYVENSFKHGLLHITRHKRLTIEVNQEASLLVVTIKDNGIGRKKSTELLQLRNPNHQSFGHKASKNRIDLLNYGRQEKIEETIIDLEDESGQPVGTLVELRIPIEDD